MEKYGQQWTMTDDNGKRWPTMDIDRLHAVDIDDTPQNEGRQRQQRQTSTMVGDDDDAQKRQ